MVLGTINAIAHPGQAELVKKLVKQGTRLITVALRMPYDLAAYPEASTYICTYSILPPAMEALAEALFGRIAFTGALACDNSRKIRKEMKSRRGWWAVTVLLASIRESPTPLEACDEWPSRCGSQRQH